MILLVVMAFLIMALLYGQREGMSETCNLHKVLQLSNDEIGKTYTPFCATGDIEDDTTECASASAGCSDPFFGVCPGASEYINNACVPP